MAKADAWSTDNGTVKLELSQCSIAELTAADELAQSPVFRPGHSKANDTWTGEFETAEKALLFLHSISTLYGSYPPQNGNALTVGNYYVTHQKLGELKKEKKTPQKDMPPDATSEESRRGFSNNHLWR